LTGQNISAEFFTAVTKGNESKTEPQVREILKDILRELSRDEEIDRKANL
jgi:predicted Zn-dependent peptidase